ncbi:hypothetical protein GON03_12410 [Nocardioides sp. MAH-18]|uniref:Uncharacterized protein n=1 Tax=Nocardioides agri TaxID=2682843 RepID=A0A6L6XSJ7_9ACTN|nr:MULTISPECIES: hypothetical protein [unclassified Nocardioides]MBA2955135.1 hypothetical protein [Nocardioides sp. CGMCC 1.13656]MVQ49988.1 hypothetical protein [Nocardioides sp. MAH-18]
MTVLDARPAAETPPAWEPRAVARARGLADLLSRRPELVGVYRPADVTAEALRWTA